VRFPSCDPPATAGGAGVLGNLDAARRCRFGGAVSYFDEDNAIEQAIGALKTRISAPIRVLNLTIAPDQITLRAQDVANRNRVDEWRFERMNVAGVNWDRTSGPNPYQISLINPNLEANLFELDEVDFAATIKLARAAIERAGLANKAQVTRMKLARQVTCRRRQAARSDGQWT
jgi:hypothetical protein